MNNIFCHVELNTDDPGKAKEFYGALFNWKFQDMPMGPHVYTGLDTGGKPGGGIQKKPMPEAPTQWLTYVHVENVTATLEKAVKLGGTVVVPRTEIPNMGHFGILVDPTGAPMGLWEGPLQP
jgi:hypothetical protein